MLTPAPSEPISPRLASCNRGLRGGGRPDGLRRNFTVEIDRESRRIRILDWRGVEVSWSSGFPRPLPRLEILEVRAPPPLPAHPAE